MSDTDQIRTKPSVSAGIVEKYELPGRLHVVYEPGNGTRYDVLLVPLEGLHVMGCFAAGGPAYWMVSLLNLSMKCYPLTSISHPGYIAQKLDVSRLTALTLAELLGFVLGGVDVIGPPVVK